MSRSGCIFWLPPEDNISPQLLLSPAPNLPKKGYNHPVLVLSSAGQTDTILILTSTPPPPQASTSHIPIHPSPSHPSTGTLLHIAHNRTLRKNSYIRISARYTINRHILRAYERETGLEYRLTETSWRVLSVVLGEQLLPMTLSSPTSTRPNIPVAVPARMATGGQTPRTWAEVVARPREVAQELPRGREQRASSYVDEVYNARTGAARTHVAAVASPAVPCRGCVYIGGGFTHNHGYAGVDERQRLIARTEAYRGYQTVASSRDDGELSCGEVLKAMVVVGLIVGVWWYFGR